MKRKRSSSPLNTVALIGAVAVVCMMYLGITSGVSIGSGVFPVLCDKPGGCTVTLSPTTSINPVLTQHTVTATTNGTDAGVPIWFSVISSSNCVGGANAGEACLVNADCASNVCDPTAGGNVGATFIPNPCFTSGNPASCSSYYIGGTTSTIDTIRACGDFSTTTQGVSDDISYADCASNDDGVPDNPDVLSTGGINVNFPGQVFKTWLENFCTGGGRIGVGGKPTHTFGGNFGANPVPDPAPDFIGQWQIVKHTAPKVSCHFNTFTNLVFSGVPTTSPPSNHNICDVDMSGSCNDGNSVSGHLRIEDLGEPGKGIDKISYTATTGPLASFPGNPVVITGGNLQVHQIFGP